MSGGVAYVIDTDGLFVRRCNTSMVELERLEEEEDIELVRGLIASHAGHTGSTLAADALSSWPLTCSRMVKVIPKDYKRILVAQARAKSERSGSSPSPSSWGSRVGKITGFMEIQRGKHPARPIAERVRDWKEVYLPETEADMQAQGARCMDCGIPFCHQGCPLGNLIPDWNDLVYKNRWTGHRAVARHEQLSGVHGAALPGAVRGIVRPGNQRRSCDDQEPGAVDRRAGIQRGLDRAGATRRAHGQAGRRGGIGSGRPGGGGPAESRRAHRHGVRAGRPHRRVAAVRHSRVQDGKASAGSAPGADGAGGGHLQAGSEHRGGHTGLGPARRFRRDRALPRRGHRPAGIFRFRAARPRASISLSTTSPSRTAAAKGMPWMTRPSSPRKGAASASSSAEATRGRTAWARRTGRGRVPWRSSN